VGLFKLFRPATAHSRWSRTCRFHRPRFGFLVQKGLYEYSRARAGHYAKVLFREQGFIDAVERSRWRAFSAWAAMVGELSRGWLRPYESGTGASTSTR